MKESMLMNKQKIRYVVMVLTVMSVFVNMVKPVPRDRDIVSIALVGQDLYEIQIKVPEGMTVVVMCSWEYKNTGHIYMMIVYEDTTTKFIAQNTTIYVSVYIYQDNTLVDNYSFEYSPDFITWVLVELYSNISIILGAIIVVLVLYIIVRKISGGE